MRSNAPAAARPRPKVPRTATEKMVELVALAGVVALVAAAAGVWRAATGPVPMHFGADGRVDAWGHRSNLLVVAAVAASLYVAMTVLARFPHVFNYSVRITEQNAAAQYQNARSLLGWLKAEIVWLFAYTLWLAVPAAASGAPSLGAAFLPIALVTVFLTLAIHIARMLRLR